MSLTSRQFVLWVTLLVVIFVLEVIASPLLLIAVRRMQFVNAQVGWIAGDSGLLKTEDGGFNWTRVSSRFPAGVSRCAVVDSWFVDERVGWAITWERIVKTTDGGLTWQDQTPLHSVSHLTPPKLRHIFFVDSQHGWVGGQSFPKDQRTGDSSEGPIGFLLKTNDGGKNWTAIEVGEIRIKDLHVIDRETVWLGGGDHILRSEDGGKSWLRVQPTQRSRVSVEEILFWETRHGWILTRSGALFRTQDGGVSWESTAFEVGTSFETIHFVNRFTGWLAGSWMKLDEFPRNPKGVLLKTLDGGKTWKEQARISGTRLTPYLISETHGWMAERIYGRIPREIGFRLHQTLDGGETWEAIFEGPTEPCPEWP